MISQKQTHAVPTNIWTSSLFMITYPSSPLSTPSPYFPPFFSPPLVNIHDPLLLYYSCRSPPFLSFHTSPSPIPLHPHFAPHQTFVVIRYRYSSSPLLPALPLPLLFHRALLFAPYPSFSSILFRALLFHHPSFHISFLDPLSPSPPYLFILLALLSYVPVFPLSLITPSILSYHPCPFLI